MKLFISSGTNLCIVAKYQTNWLRNDNQNLAEKNLEITAIEPYMLAATTLH